MARNWESKHSKHQLYWKTAYQTGTVKGRNLIFFICNCQLVRVSSFKSAINLQGSVPDVWAVTHRLHLEEKWKKWSPNHWQSVIRRSWLKSPKHRWLPRRSIFLIGTGLVRLGRRKIYYSKKGGTFTHLKLPDAQVFPTQFRSVLP